MGPEKGELLRQKQIEGIGNKRVSEDGKVTKVGAGGWGGGVNLAVSNETTQQRNKEMLHKFLKKQRRKQQRMEEKQKKQKEGSEK